MQCTAKQHKNCDIASNERLFHLCIVCFQPIGPHYFEILSMHVHAFSSSTVYLKKACESRQTFDVSGLLRLLRILSPNSTFIIAKTLYMYSNFSKKTNIKKKTQVNSFASICIFSAKVCFVCSYYGRSNHYQNTKIYMCLPGSNFQGLCYSQTAFFILGILGN